MRSFASSLFLLPAIIRSSIATSETNSSSTRACNNSPKLCDLPYNNVTYLGAHDAPFLMDASTSYSSSGNQAYNATELLSAGIRLLTGQVHSYNSTWHLCHSSCALMDAGLLSDWLAKIKYWMDDHPDEVVTILLVNSDDASASDLGGEYETANITSLAYEPDSSSAPSEWPTLNTLIENGTRLMNFVASLDDNSDAPYLMDEFTYIFENPYDNTSPSNFSCTADRPSSVSGKTSTAISKNLMPLMNHFLYESQIFDIETPNTTYINVTNGLSDAGDGNLESAAEECKSEYGFAPTFLLVDFANAGPAIETADSMNGITIAYNRISLSTSVKTTSTSGAFSVGSSPAAVVAGVLAAVTILMT